VEVLVVCIYLAGQVSRFQILFAMFVFGTQQIVGSGVCYNIFKHNWLMEALACLTINEARNEKKIAY